jgi:hypothetical protein
MNKKFRSSLIGLSALALVFTGVLNAPSQAAKRLPMSLSQSVELSATSNAKLKPAQIARFKKKLAKASHLTLFQCEIKHAEDISEANLAKVTKAARTACQSARAVTKNLKNFGYDYTEDPKYTGTKFKLEIYVYGPRIVYFNQAGLNISLPADSKILKFNGSYQIPQAPTGEVTAASFVSWNTRMDGTGTDYQPGQRIKVKHQVGLYPKYVGYTLNFNIVGLDKSYGSNYQILYHNVMDFDLQPVFSKSVQLFVPTDENMLVMYAPGTAANSSPFSVTEGLSVNFAGTGFCGSIASVEMRCSIYEISFTQSGTVTYNFNNYIPD